MWLFNDMVETKRVQSKPLAQRPIVFLDIETTSLDYVTGEILEVAMIRTDRAQGFVAKCPMTCYATATAEALELVGYNVDEWRDAKLFSEIAPEIWEWCATDGPAIVAHNGDGFDRLFLTKRMQTLGYPFHQCGRPWIDTRGIAFMKLRNRVSSLSLDSLCIHFQIPPEKRHRAMGGAKRVKAIYERLEKL